MIVISHLSLAIPQFEDSASLMYFEAGIGNIGVALFVFLSGYSLMIKNSHFVHPSEIKPYMMKRFSRLFPLYWLALFTLYLVTAVQHDLGSWDVQLDGSSLLQYLIYLSGLQILFANLLYNSSSLIYWFVSAILIYYLMFPILLFGASRIGEPFSRSLILMALSIFLIVWGVGTIYSGIDQRLLIFYWFFIAGIVLGKSNRLSDIKSTDIVKIVLPSAVGAATIFIVNDSLSVTIPLVTPWDPTEVLAGLNVIFFGAGCIAIAIYLSLMLKRFLLGGSVRLFERVSRSTYAIYLFHYYILLLIASLSYELGQTPMTFIVILVGISLTMLIPLYIQDLLDRATSFVLRRSTIF